MRSLKDIHKERGGGLFQNIKGFFTRKKSKVAPHKSATHKNTVYQRVKGKLKGLNKPPTSAPTQYPTKSYPFFKGNERDSAELDPMNVQIVEQRSVESEWTKEVDTRTMGPPTSNTPASDIIEMTLPIEPYRDGLRRMGLFFYNKLQTAQGKPQSSSSLYASIPEMNTVLYAVRDYVYRRYPAYFRTDLSKEEEDAAVEDLNRDIAQELFGVPEEQLDAEIQEAEHLNFVFPSLADSNRLQFANRYGGYLARYIPVLARSLRKLDYLSDHADNDCKATIAGEERPRLKSLDSSFCICCFLDYAHFERYKQEGIKGCSQYSIFHPEYFPHAKDYAKKPMPVLLTASKFLATSFVQDAFKEQGLHMMDENLYTLIQKKAPELVESSKVFLATADKFKHLKLYDHFMIFTEKALPEGLIVTYKDPLLLAAVRRAFDESREFLLADPYTAYCTKKKNPGLWSKAFGIKIHPTKGVYSNSNFESYALLRDVEKLYIDFCQYQLVIGKYLDLTQNSTRASTEETLKKASELYKASIKDKKFVEMMASVASGEKIFGEFKKIQKTLITYDTPLQTIEDVRALISKLNPGWRRAQPLFEPAPRQMPTQMLPQPQSRGTLRLARVIPPLPESPRMPALPPSPPSTPRSNTGSVNSTNSYVPLPETIAADSKEQQIQETRQLLQEINSELLRATPIYMSTRRKHGFRSNAANNAITTKYNTIIKRPRATWSRTEADFMKNYDRILRNFSLHRNTLLQTRQQKLDLLQRLGATSV
jgi:hypothetical protein